MPGSWVRRFQAIILAAASSGVLVALPPRTTWAAGGPAFDAVVSAIQSLPYQPAYVPAGYDAAFPAGTVPDAPPASDYTTGSIPGAAPAWPPAFQPVVIQSADGAKLTGELALLPGQRPGVVVAHGFNTHGNLSVIRWAAMLVANGYNVLAADQRDFAAEYQAGYGYPGYPQTFGWKESQDVLAAGRFLASRPGVTSVGLVGFSEGAQNAVLALSQDLPRVFSAAITFSGPADQDSQIYSTAQPPGCSTPACTYPATDALVQLVVPPYSSADVCQVLGYAAGWYGTNGWQILSHASAMHAQTAIQVPLLNFYAADDSLVSPVHARMMAAYETGKPLQRTLEVQRGEHAYFYDRWWQQMAILTYFHDLLPGGGRASVAATVNRTPGGGSFQSQEVSLGSPTPAWGDAQLARYVCDTSQPPPGG